MADNFNFKKFITENKTGPYARLNEAPDTKEIEAYVNKDRYGNLEGLYLRTYINGVENEYELGADINNDDEWDVQGGVKIVDNEETPISDQEVSALLNDKAIWQAVDNAFSKYERPSDDDYDGPDDDYDDSSSYRDIHGPTHKFEEAAIEEAVNPEMDNKVRRIVKAIARENQTPLASAAAAVVASIKRLESEFKDK
jgi:hypothetical protein